MARVEFTLENADKCQCPKCPVQASSNCAQDKIQNVMDMQRQDQPADEAVPDPQEMPGLYCAEAVGKSTCQDLDFEQTCICGTCAVHQENNLMAGYYCRAGSADING
jgi:hypothetical protein